MDGARTRGCQRFVVERVVNGGVIGEHREDRSASLEDFSNGTYAGRTKIAELDCRLIAPVPHRDTVALLEQPARHGGAHPAKAYVTDITHGRILFLLLSAKSQPSEDVLPQAAVDAQDLSTDVAGHVAGEEHRG
ncbi:hypothetical protein PD653_1137 [Nocardioides sp. PD653]|nr:hypothetical protein PD653B2_0274 [Nocardioides sp. PD653-B2]GAW53734.1 hypothetical protein PD653_1137 [Nocardioides sp. PD653]